MSSKVFFVLTIGLMICLLGAAFPPRQHQHGGEGQPNRVWLFSADSHVHVVTGRTGGQMRYSVEIEAGRLLAESLLILGATVLLALLLHYYSGLPRGELL